MDLALKKLRESDALAAEIEKDHQELILLHSRLREAHRRQEKQFLLCSRHDQTTTPPSHSQNTRQPSASRL